VGGSSGAASGQAWPAAQEEGTQAWQPLDAEQLASRLASGSSSASDATDVPNVLDSTARWVEQHAKEAMDTAGRAGP
jgi:hypothetical protein